MNNRKQVIIFGGAFNPPTKTHIRITEACLNMPSFSEVWIMPSKNRVDKTINTTFSDRKKMLKLIKKHIFANNKRLIICDYEAKMPGLTSTHKTFQKLKNDFQNTDFWFALGADSYTSLPEWPHYEQLLDGVGFIIFNRDNTHYKLLSPKHIKAESDFPNMSSTLVRNTLAKGECTKHLLIEPIIKYIQQNNLYRL